MSMRSRLVVLAGLAVLGAALMLGPPARAQRVPEDCVQGYVFANGECEEIRGGNGGGSNDAACVATARFDYCQRSVYIGCNVNRQPYACRLLQLSSQDPNTFQQIMSAQKACTLDGNQQACAYLGQFRGVYF